jgi:hypothetical protein
VSHFSDNDYYLSTRQKVELSSKMSVFYFILIFHLSDSNLFVILVVAHADDVHEGFIDPCIIINPSVCVSMQLQYSIINYMESLKFNDPLNGFFWLGNE